MRFFSTDPNQPGVFAVGQVAVGVFAFGQLALGVIAVGQVARGVFALGQGAIGVCAVGQGAIGLWYAGGMMAFAGTRGFGGVLHLLPRVVRAAAPDLPPCVAVADLLEGAVADGWIDAAITTSREPPHTAQIALPELDDPRLVDTSAIASVLDAARAAGQDRARVHVQLEQAVVDKPGYREARRSDVLVARAAMGYRSVQPRELRYGAPGWGKPTVPPTTASLVARTSLWLLAAALVSALALVPLVDALRR